MLVRYIIPACRVTVIFESVSPVFVFTRVPFSDPAVLSAEHSAAGLAATGGQTLSESCSQRCSTFLPMLDHR